MRLRPLRCAALVLSVLACQHPWAQPGVTPVPLQEKPPTRGQLLYSTHCIACHNSQMHWRDEKLATDWASLKAQVRRWQARASLGWSEADIVEVARHLNDTIYLYRQTSDVVGQLSSLR
jgi:mono/diheme cytochrome c family protein